MHKKISPSCFISQLPTHWQQRQICMHSPLLTLFKPKRNILFFERWYFLFFFFQLSWRWFHSYVTHLCILFSSCIMFHWTPVPRYIPQCPVNGYWGCSSLLWFQHVVLWILFPYLIEHTCEQICRTKDSAKAESKMSFFLKKKLITKMPHAYYILRQ